MKSVRLTLLDIRKFNAEKILSGLPEELRKKASRYRKDDDQLCSIGSSFLLLKAAKGHEIHYSTEGKPFTNSENHFNISHSGNYVVLAETGSPAGVEGNGFTSEPNEIDSLTENDFDDPVLYEGKYYRIDSFMFDGHVISFAVNISGSNHLKTITAQISSSRSIWLRYFICQAQIPL